MSSVPPPLPQTGGDAGRVRCLYCGANNFPASAACWQCGRALKAMPPGADAGGPPGSPALLPSSPGGRPPFAESALAPKAAAAMGMLFPYVGLPAGILFLMLDDPRKTQLGWLLIGWSLLGSVLSVISLIATLGPVWAILKAMLPHAAGGGAPGGMPDLGGAGAFLSRWPARLVPGGV